MSNIRKRSRSTKEPEKQYSLVLISVNTSKGFMRFKVAEGNTKTLDEITLDLVDLMLVVRYPYRLNIHAEQDIINYLFNNFSSSNISINKTDYCLIIDHTNK